MILACGAVLVTSACTREAREARRLQARAAKLRAPAVLMVFPSISEMPGQGPFLQAAWFRNEWFRARLDAWEQREKARGAVVFLGDSITAGWTGLGVAFPQLKVVNRGIPGDTSRGAAYRLRDDILAADPDRIVLLIGINDILHGASPEAIVRNVEAILTQCQQSRPAMSIVLCQILPVGAPHEQANNRVQSLNLLLRTLPARFAQLTFCDTWTPLADESGGARKTEFPDGLHLNEAGYAKLAKALGPCLATNRDSSKWQFDQ